MNVLPNDSFDVIWPLALSENEMTKVLGIG